MKNVLLVLSFLLVLAIPAASQTVRFLPDPNAPMVDMFRGVVRISPNLNEVPDPSRNSGAYDAIFVIGGYRTQNGKIEYQIISDSIRLVGDDGLIDNTPTHVVYSIIAKEAMMLGIVRGWTPAPDCATPWYANVYSEPCVRRMGTGAQTRFVPCDRVNYSTWKYSVCRNPGDTMPTINRIPFFNPFVCDGFCEPTCPNQDGGTVIQ